VGVEWHTLLSSCGLGYGHRHTEDSIGSEFGLVLGAIELVEEVVDCRLVLDIDVLLDQRWCNDVVDVADGLGDTYTTKNQRCVSMAGGYALFELTFATPLALVAVTELACLV